jgi:hypothetical protein
MKQGLAGSLVVAVLVLSATPRGAVAQTCSNVLSTVLAAALQPELSKLDACKDLKQEIKVGLTASVQAAELRLETERRKALYSFIGVSGEAAVSGLRYKGFACQFEVLNSVQGGGALPKPADLTLYRCSISDSASCACRRLQITIGLGPQTPVGRPSEYQAAPNSTVVERKFVTQTCFPEQR